MTDDPTDNALRAAAEATEKPCITRAMRAVDAVFNSLSNSEWKTLSSISKETGFPEAGVSARIRDLRKKEFGSHIVERRHEGRIFFYKLAAETPNERDQLLADLAAAKAREERLRAALTDLTEHYVSLADSGDAGFWNAEEEAVVMSARTALAHPTVTDEVK